MSVSAFNSLNQIKYKGDLSVSGGQLGLTVFLAAASYDQVADFLTINDVYYLDPQSNPTSFDCARIANNYTVNDVVPGYKMRIANESTTNDLDVYETSTNTVIGTIPPQFSALIIAKAEGVTSVTPDEWIFINNFPFDADGLQIPLYNVNNTVFVDDQYGDDATGIRESPFFMFQTILAAYNAANAGDIILVHPGTYAEFNIPMVKDVTYNILPGVTLNQGFFGSPFWLATANGAIFKFYGHPNLANNLPLLDMATFSGTINIDATYYATAIIDLGSNSNNVDVYYRSRTEGLEIRADGNVNMTIYGTEDTGVSFRVPAAAVVNIDTFSCDILSISTPTGSISANVVFNITSHSILGTGFRFRNLVTPTCNLDVFSYGFIDLFNSGNNITYSGNIYCKYCDAFNIDGSSNTLSVFTDYSYSPIRLEGGTFVANAVHGIIDSVTANAIVVGYIETTGPPNYVATSHLINMSLSSTANPINFIGDYVIIGTAERFFSDKGGIVGNSFTSTQVDPDGWAIIGYAEVLGVGDRAQVLVNYVEESINISGDASLLVLGRVNATDLCKFDGDAYINTFIGDKGGSSTSDEIQIGFDALYEPSIIIDSYIVANLGNNVIRLGDHGITPENLYKLEIRNFTINTTTGPGGPSRVIRNNSNTAGLNFKGGIIHNLGFILNAYTNNDGAVIIDVDDYFIDSVGVPFIIGSATSTGSLTNIIMRFGNFRVNVSPNMTIQNLTNVNIYIRNLIHSGFWNWFFANNGTGCRVNFYVERGIIDNSGNNIIRYLNFNGSSGPNAVAVVGGRYKNTSVNACDLIYTPNRLATLITKDILFDGPASNIITNTLPIVVQNEGILTTGVGIGLAAGVTLLFPAPNVRDQLGTALITF